MNLKYLFFFLLLPNFLFAQQTEVVYLSGTGAENTVDWEFYCSAGMNSGHWTAIAVPSCWEQQGFGSYNYGHDKFEERLNETGLYRHKFTVPREWSKKEVSIIFDGVMTDALVKINGKQAGPVHQGAFYQFGYDIGKLLKYGQENHLEVLVKKHSDNVSVSRAERQADFWIFGGIFRPVRLEAKPGANIQRVAIDARASGEFRADVYLSNPAITATGSRKKSGLMKVEIQTIDGKTVAGLENTIDAKAMRITGLLENPKTWSPEFPNLYQATFSLTDKDGNVLHRQTERFGFRTVEVHESDGIYVNGVRIKMKGVNRHTFHPKYGRTSSKQLSIAAVNLMKDMNMNAVRSSHYPPDKHFLDACDSLGLFVIDELTAWQKPSYDDIAGRKLLEEMISHDVNHPSIILWANGNEGGENNNLNDDFAELDIQQRKVLHPWQDYDLTNTLHYINYNYLSLDGFSKRKIFFPTEFLHGLYDGGHGAGLDDYWLRMWAHPLCAGGFLWVFADEAVERTDRGRALDTDGNHAPDGILGPYSEKEGSFYTIREIWSPVYIEKKYITTDFDGKLPVENRYFYTNLDQCRFVAEWLDLSVPYMVSDQAVETILKTEILSIDMDPGQQGTLEIQLPEKWQGFDALRLTATDLYGRKLNTWCWPLKTAEVAAREALENERTREAAHSPKFVEAANSVQRPQFTETNAAFIVNTGNISIEFKKADGTISRILQNGKLIPLSNGPVIVNNEKKITGVTPETFSDTFSLKVLFENGDHFIWSIRNDGMVRLDVAYEPGRNGEFAGITFDFPEKNVSAMRWLGNGPYRVYKNRMKGVTFGLWEKSYNNTVTGESGYEYPEFKGYHSNIYRAEIQGKDVPGFKVHILSDDIFLKMLTPAEPRNPANTAMIYPPGDISFLHGINAIGTKFLKPVDLGPQSSPHFFSSSRIHGGKLNMRLVFDFK